MANMKSEQHVWDEIHQSVLDAVTNLRSDVIKGIRDMEKVDEVIRNSGYGHLYLKRGGGSSAQLEKMVSVAEETLYALNTSTMHRNTLASIDSKFAEKMKYAIEDYLNKVNEGDRKYVGSTMHTVDKTVTVANDDGTNTTMRVQESVPLTADELMKLNHPKLQGLKERYQNELEAYKNKMLSDEQTQLSDEQKKNIEEMNVTQFLGYTGSVGEYKGALSDQQESLKTFMLIADIGIALGAAVLAPCTGGASLGVAAAYFVTKAAYGVTTGRSLLVNEKLSDEDKAWLIFDAATSILAAGAAMKVLSNGGKIASAIAKTAVIGDHTMNLVQAGMAGTTGVQMLQKGDVLGGVTLLGLAAIGVKGTTKAVSKVTNEVEEQAAKAVSKTNLAAERMNQFVSKVDDLKIKGLNAIDNASAKFADAMGLGDNLAFAGVGGSLGKNLHHADDFVGRTVARVEGAVDGQLDEVVKHVEKNYKVSGKEIPIPESKADEILRTPKGQRPDPSEYLSQEYIDKHLEQFKEGGSFLMTQDQYDDFVRGNDFIGFPDNSQFVASKTDIDNLIKNSKGDISKIEEKLGFDKNHFANHGGLVKIDIHNPNQLNVRVPSGNEGGANSWWRPGGITSGGTSEAVTNRIPNTKEYVTINFL